MAVLKELLPCLLTFGATRKSWEKNFVKNCLESHKFFTKTGVQG